MLRTRKFMIPVAALLAVFGLAAVVFMVRASANDMLYAAAGLLETTDSLHAVGSFEADTPEESASGTVELWFAKDAGPNGEPAFRIEILEASKADAVGMVAVGDGTQFWVYNPQENKVLTGTAEEMKARLEERYGEYEHNGDAAPEDVDMPETPAEMVDKLLEYVTAERQGGADISGMAAEQIRLVPIPEQMPDELRANGGFFNVWLRDSDNAPLGVEYAEGAVGYFKATASELELNPAIDPAVFSFEIPAGAEVVNAADLELPEPPEVSLAEAEATTAYDVLSPAELPAGARELNIVEVRGAVVQRYALPDGGRFTVAQGPADAAEMAPESEGQATTVRGLQGTLYVDENGERSLLAWQENGVSFWVGGDISAEQAFTIAESLQ